MDLPGARFTDHVGLNVPDLDTAVAFFTDTLGATLLFRAGPWPVEVSLAGGQRLQSPLTLALLRFGPQFNVELLAYGPEIPLALDGAHLAIFVDDLDAAAERIRQWPGTQMIQEAQTVVGGPSAGLRYAYFRTPWGQRLEVLWYPEQLPYTEHTPARAYRFPGPWTTRAEDPVTAAHQALEALAQTYRDPASPQARQLKLWIEQLRTLPPPEL